MVNICNNGFCKLQFKRCIYLIEKCHTTDENIKIEDYDIDVYRRIEDKIQGHDKVEMLEIEKKFLNGIIRKYKPKKLLEIGVSKGGSSAIILNAINDIEGSKLYSIDIQDECYRIPGKKTGFLIEESFPELKSKWEFHTNEISANCTEKVGKDIDFCFIDTVHMMPGEMLDILAILPFLKENAVIVLHDICLHLRSKAIYKHIYSNNQIFACLKGKKMLPTSVGTGEDMGGDVFFNIGAVELDSHQEDYYFDYFFALSFHWEYMPDESQIKIFRSFIEKYYDKKYINMFDVALKKNRTFNPAVPPWTRVDV